MGNVLFQLGKEQEALAEFKEAKKIDKNSPLPELAMAQRNDEAKKRDAAKKWIQDAIKAAPTDPAVQLFAARWYLQQNDLEAAKAAADTALKLDAKNLEAKFVRGLVARVGRDYATSQKFLNEAHFQSPGNFDVSNSLALVLIESDDEEARRRALELADTNVAKYRENTPQQIPAVTTLAWVFYRLGRREDAEQMADAESCDSVTQHGFDDGTFDAVMAIKLIRELSPRNVDADYRAAVLEIVSSVR
jgi:tetratricopeptide (TPR) repeat protein